MLLTYSNNHVIFLYSWQWVYVVFLIAFTPYKREGDCTAYTDQLFTQDYPRLHTAKENLTNMDLIPNSTPIPCSDGLKEILYNNEEIDFLPIPITDEEQAAYLASPSATRHENLVHQHWLMHYNPRRPQENASSARRQLFPSLIR